MSNIHAKLCCLHAFVSSGNNLHTIMYMHTWQSLHVSHTCTCNRIHTSISVGSPKTGFPVLLIPPDAVENGGGGGGGGG